MAYGIKYKVPFAEYELQISERDYVGAFTTLTAGASAVRHSWGNDDPITPVRGSAIDLNVIGVPLRSFYSDDDEKFKGDLFYGSQLLFSGYLVQDDSGEPLDDLTHIVRLSFTDGLGLLKETRLDEALKNSSQTQYTLDFITVNTSGNTIDVALTFFPDESFDLYDGATLLGHFTIATVVDADTYTTTTTLPTLSGFRTIARPIAQPDKITLFDVIRACLTATGILLPLDIYCDLREDNQTTDTPFFAQTLISKDTFLESDRVYKKCYEVLEGIMADTLSTLMQAEGKWVIKRNFEIAPTRYSYTSSFVLIGTSLYSLGKLFGRNEPLNPVYPYDQRVVRPFKKVQETFKYTSLFNVIKNADLKDLGTLIREYDVPEETYNPGADNNSTNEYNVRYKEYNAPYWTPNNIAGPNEVYIRLIEDDLHYEIERYLVVEKNATQASNEIAVFATPIELSKGDVIEFSFSFRTSVNNTQPSPDIGFNAFLTAGAYTTPANRHVDFTSGVDYRLKYTSEWFVYGSTFSDDYGGKNSDTSNKWVGVDVSQWQSVSIRSKRAPVDGMLYIFLSDLAGSTFLADGAETHYKDFSFKVLYSINDSTTITGQTHTRTQVSKTKNNSETDLTIDDSPRNSIAGTLFLPTVGSTGQLQRTRQWNTGQRLGEVITQELKQWRSRARTIFEGDLFAETYADVNLSPLNFFGNPAFPYLTCIPGRMEIDYANRMCTGTLHEIHEVAESEVINEYKFEYSFGNR